MMTVEGETASIDSTSPEYEQCTLILALLAHGGSYRTTCSHGYTCTIPRPLHHATCTHCMCMYYPSTITSRHMYPLHVHVLSLDHYITPHVPTACACRPLHHVTCTHCMCMYYPSTITSRHMYPLHVHVLFLDHYTTSHVPTACACTIPRPLHHATCTHCMCMYYPSTITSRHMYPLHVHVLFLDHYTTSHVPTACACTIPRPLHHVTCTHCMCMYYSSTITSRHMYPLHVHVLFLDHYITPHVPTACACRPLHHATCTHCMCMYYPSTITSRHMYPLHVHVLSLDHYITPHVPTACACTIPRPLHHATCTHCMCMYYPSTITSRHMYPLHVHVLFLDHYTTSHVPTACACTIPRPLHHVTCTHCMCMYYSSTITSRHMYPLHVHVLSLDHYITPHVPTGCACTIPRPLHHATCTHCMCMYYPSTITSRHMYPLHVHVLSLDHYITPHVPTACACTIPRPLHHATCTHCMCMYYPSTITSRHMYPLHVHVLSLDHYITSHVPTACACTIPRPLHHATCTHCMCMSTITSRHMYPLHVHVLSLDHYITPHVPTACACTIPRPLHHATCTHCMCMYYPSTITSRHMYPLHVHVLSLDHYITSHVPTACACTIPRPLHHVTCTHCMCMSTITSRHMYPLHVHVLSLDDLTSHGEFPVY